MQIWVARIKTNETVFQWFVRAIKCVSSFGQYVDLTVVSIQYWLAYASQLNRIS